MTTTKTVHKIVQWSHDERFVCLSVEGENRWFKIDWLDGRFSNPRCEIDGRTYEVNSQFAVRYSA